MSDYTTAEVEAALDPVIEEEGWGELAYLTDNADTREISLRGEQVKVGLVTRVGGCEGGGEEAWFVLGIGDQMFRKNGWYMSHEGTTWDGDFKEVKPVVKPVTFYEAK